MVSCELLCTLNFIVDIVYIGYNDEKKVGEVRLNLALQKKWLNQPEFHIS